MFKAPERMAGVMMKVTEEVKEEHWRVVHMDEQGLSTDYLMDIWKPKSDGWRWVAGRETHKVMTRGGRVEPGGRSLKKNKMIHAHRKNIPNVNGDFL